MTQKFIIRTFGCQQNVADSERLATYYRARGYVRVSDEAAADLVVINSCMIREKAEERVYGYIRNLRAARGPTELRIVLTGCIVGAAAREPSGRLAKKLAARIPDVELLPIEEAGFEYAPERAPSATKHAWVVVSSGCNNYCAFCIVPFARGREVSRPYGDILSEVHALAAEGYTSVTLLGQNVNSYGADLVLATRADATEGDDTAYVLPDGARVAPVWVTHLGRTRIPTLFPHLLAAVAAVPGITKVTFTSSNPWDFSDALIDVIAAHPTIDRLIHLPVQSGSTKILKAMNRWYTREEYIALTDRIRAAVPDVTFATDIIVGFPGETEEDFQETLSLIARVGFVKSFTGCYSPRPGTTATKSMPDTIPWEEKKRRWRLVDEATNKAHAGVSAAQDWIVTRQANRVEE